MSDTNEPHPLGVALMALDAHGHKTCAEALAEHCAGLYDTVAELRAQLAEARAKALEEAAAVVEAWDAWDGDVYLDGCVPQSSTADAIRALSGASSGG